MCQVRNKIDRCKRGTMFFANSFPGVTEKYANNVLGELVNEGVILRVAQGVYVKPVIGRFGIVKPQVSDVVKAIAKRNKESILPSGVTALNMLGLSEQVPAKITYVTSGSARTITIDGKAVKFTTSVPRTFMPKNEFMAVLFLALKAWNRDELTEEFNQNVIKLLRYHAEVKDSMLKDLEYAPKWIKDYLEPKIAAI